MKSVYLCGSIEYSKDGGLGWRREFKRSLEDNFNIECVIPNDEEECKYDMPTLKTADLNKYIEIMRSFIKMDLEFVENADLLICKWSGEVTSGTNHEVGYAYQLNKPCYLVTSKTPQEVPGWFLACFTSVFKTLEELVEHLRSTGC